MAGRESLIGVRVDKWNSPLCVLYERDRFEAAIVTLHYVVLGKNSLGRFIRNPTMQKGKSLVPSFDGTQFTSWNFFACTTNT